jgi:hypothetical protein
LPGDPFERFGDLHDYAHIDIFNPIPTVALGITLALLTGVQWAHLLSADVSAWDLASRDQLRVLERVRALAPHLDRYDISLVFGGPAYTRPSVPVFAASWDLNGAVQLYYNDFTLATFPIISGNHLTCTVNGIVSSKEQGLPSMFPYHNVVLIDIATGDVNRPIGLHQCAKALPAFMPGPLTTLPAPAV